MSRLAVGWIVLFSFVCVGCSTPRATRDGVIIFVPGVSGDGPWYDNLKRGLRDGGATLPIESIRWGAPSPLFMLNFNNVGIHTAAEEKLAARLTKIHSDFPAAPIIVLTHSAGGGVALGAIKQLPIDINIDRVVLLHPSVSPTYDLAAALERVQDRVIVFHSDRDTTFLKWRTSNFGTYDNVKTIAAGNSGFSTTQLSRPALGKLRQIAFDESFQKLGNDGGHFGPTARSFAAQHIAPLLQTD
jgi:pimeloyl-ACP methyl ester carboxylesterase